MAKGSTDPYDLIIREREVTRAEKRVDEREADLERRERVLAKAPMKSSRSRRPTANNHAKHLSVIRPLRIPRCFSASYTSVLLRQLHNSRLLQQFHNWVYQTTILLLLRHAKTTPNSSARSPRSATSCNGENRQRRRPRRWQRSGSAKPMRRRLGRVMNDI